MARRLFAGTVAVLVVGAALAHAEPGSRGSDEAERRFRSGQALASRGDFAAACREFDASHRLEPSLGTALNLADCEAHTGKLATAIDRLRDALGRLPRGDDRVAPARQALADLERRVPRLTLVLAPDAPRGTRVALADRSAAARRDLRRGRSHGERRCRALGGRDVLSASAERGAPGALEGAAQVSAGTRRRCRRRR